jgi:hypothetical protein
MLGRTFGHKRDEVTGGCRKGRFIICTLHLEQRFPNFYILSSPPPQDFALIYAPPGKKKHIKYYIWNINNPILLKRPSSKTRFF